MGRACCGPLLPHPWVHGVRLRIDKAFYPQGARPAHDQKSLVMKQTLESVLKRSSFTKWPRRELAEGGQERAPGGAEGPSIWLWHFYCRNCPGWSEGSRCTRPNLLIQPHGTQLLSHPFRAQAPGRQVCQAFSDSSPGVSVRSTSPRSKHPTSQSAV